MLACDEIVGETDDNRDNTRKEFACDQACHRRLQFLIKLSTTVLCDDVFDNPTQHEGARQKGALPRTHRQEEDGMERPPWEALTEEGEEKDERKRRDERWHGLFDRRRGGETLPRRAVVNGGEGALGLHRAADVKAGVDGHRGRRAVGPAVACGDGAFFILEIKRRGNGDDEADDDGDDAEHGDFADFRLQLVVQAEAFDGEWHEAFTWIDEHRAGKDTHDEKLFRANGLHAEEAPQDGTWENVRVEEEDACFGHEAAADRQQDEQAEAVEEGEGPLEAGLDGD